MTTQSVTLGGIKHEKVTLESNGKTFVVYYVYRTNKFGGQSRAQLNEGTHRSMIRRIEAACNEVANLH